MKHSKHQSKVSMREKLIVDDYWIKPTVGSIDRAKLFKKLEGEGWEIVCTQAYVDESITQTNFRFIHKDYGCKEFYLNGIESLEKLLEWLNGFRKTLYEKKRDKWVNDFFNELNEDCDICLIKDYLYKYYDRAQKEKVPYHDWRDR